jgi:hypothetical protein
VTVPVGVTVHAGLVVEKTTALPDAPPVAVTTPVPATTTLGALPNVIACAPLPMLMFWFAGAAAL